VTRRAWHGGNRATVYALHLEYSGANFATAEFPANGGLRERQKPLRRCSAVSNVTIAPLSTSHEGKKPDKNGVLKISRNKRERSRRGLIRSEGKAGGQ